MISEFSLSLLSATFLSVTTLIGIALYGTFAYLVAHSKNIDTRRRWRYSILWGVSSGVFSSILIASIFILVLIDKINKSGFMALLKHPISISQLFASIILFLISPVLISVPIIFVVTFGTYIKELQLSDSNVTHLLYPIKKHPSDQSHDDISNQVRIYIVGFIDG